MLKYFAYCHVHFVTSAVLEEFFSYFAHFHERVCHDFLTGVIPPKSLYNVVVGGVYLFHSICPASSVGSVAPTVLVGSISY